MSFLVDPPLLMGAGAAIERLAPDERSADLLEAGTIATVVGVSVGLYLNRPATRWLWELCGADSGRDWMLNSGVLDLEHEDVGPTTHVVSAAIFATYPLWARLGRRLAQRGGADG